MSVTLQTKNSEELVFPNQIILTATDGRPLRRDGTGEFLVKNCGLAIAENVQLYDVLISLLQ